MNKNRKRTGNVPLLSLEQIKELSPVEIKLPTQAVADEDDSFLGDSISISRESYETLLSKMEDANVDGLTDGKRIFTVAEAVDNDEYRIWQLSLNKNRDKNV